MRTVLVVAYHYPPDTAVGSMRTHRFVRYLSEFGWRPVVLTVRHGAQRSENGVIRARMLPGVRQAVRWAKGLLARGGAEPAVDDGECSPGYAAPDASQVSKPHRTLYALMWLPDDRQGWFAPAVAAGVRGVLRSGAQVVYSSGPPWTCHVVGLTVAVLTRRPLVADFRDPWVDNPAKPAFVRTRWSDRADLAMERMVVRRAAAVVCTTHALRQEMAARHRGVPDSRFVVVSNGFDPRELTEIPSAVRTNQDEVVMAYAGTLYGERDPRPLFRAASAVRANGARPFRIIFMGQCDRATGLPVAQMVRDYDLEDCVELTGQLPRSECLKRLSEADILLLFAMRQPAQVPAKLYEYIGLGKPVLALAEVGSETARELYEAKAGVAADAGDNEAVKTALKLAVAGELSGSPPEVRCRYDGRVLTGRLAEVLNAARWGRWA